MADRTQHGSRRRQSSSRSASPWVRPAPAAEAGPGPWSLATSNKPVAADLPGFRSTGLTPRATFWHLQQQGLTAGEAASLTAFMCGLPTADLRWSLGQINHMLFLQRLYQLGRFGTGEGERARPH